MTYYHEIVLRMRKSIYPNQDITDRIIRAKRYIDDNYASDINLDKIAREVYLSKFHFIRLYKKYYGRTPHTYLKEVRLIHAKQLLRTGSSVKNACHAVGFDSIPSFTRLYKAMTGLPPGASSRLRNFG